MRKRSDHTCHQVWPILTLAGLLSGLAWPGYSGGEQFTDRAAIPQATHPSWVATGNLNGGREDHTATLLPDGKVLVAGGAGYACSGNSCFAIVFNTAELYDPATGTWRYTENVGRRALHTATLLPDGRVLIVGGRSINDEVRSAELYDPVTERWSSAGVPATISKDHAATLLTDGKVLAASGNSAELYDPARGRWSAANPPRALGYAYTATLLANGQVLVTGTRSLFSTATTAELYNPATGEWTIATPVSGVGSWHTATLLANGQVLVAGGIGSNDQSISSAEIYDPATGTWNLTSALNASRG